MIWMITASRLGPDLPWTHWILHWPMLAGILCRKKFRHFGANAEFRPLAYALNTKNISIGANVVVRSGTTLGGPIQSSAELVIEDDVLIGPDVYIVCDNHEFNDPSVPIAKQGNRDSKSVVIKRGAWLGARAVILAGITIGENAVVGAGSVVTRSVAPRTVVAGNPAKEIKKL